MHASSLNHVYRLVWSDSAGCFVAVPEHAKASGKAGGGVRRRSRLMRAALAATALVAGAAATAAGLPSGGQIAAGSGSIAQSGNTLTVTQTSSKLITNWQSFGIGAGQTVQFVQPSSSAVALNRVVGADVSAIQGSLLANGRVFLLNPNGVLFSPTARVDTGGLVASTLGMSDADFLNGQYRLQGNSLAEVRNQGRLRADGGTVALIAAKVVNQGEIDARAGQVLLGAGSDVMLDVGGPVKLLVSRGALDALVDNGGAIRADGGTVLLTARSLDQLNASVVRNSGEIRAQTLVTGAKGEILLLGDMGNGQLEAGGRLDASAPVAGDGGFIETSAAHVDNASALSIDAGSRTGRAGTWLIDPYDYNINATAAGNITAALNTGTNVTVSTQANVAGYGSGGSNAGNGDITVASPIAKTAGGNATLTLLADRNITVSSAITSTAGQLGITLSAANNAAGALGGVAVNANLASNGGRILIGGAGGNQTTAQAYGIGYALNQTSSTPAVRLGTNVTIASGGGNITINGRSNATSNSYDGTKGGIYVLSGATVDTGGGNLYMSAQSTAAAKVFAFSAEASAGTVTTFKTSSTTGGMFVDANNTLDALGSLGMVNNGSQARLQFWAPSVAHMLFRLNGSNQAAVFTQSPPCNPGYPNCGTMVIPGGNQSYTSAGYNVVSMAMLPLYVFTGNGSRVYNGGTDASDVSTSFLGGPNGFSLASLGTLSFSTTAKDVGSYSSLTPGAGNPSSYSNGSYAVAYFSQGSYTVTQKQLSNFQAANKTYDGTTAAAVSASGLVGGDAVTINATGGFNAANVGNGIGVSITGVSLSGADAGNYSLPAFNTINTTANITPAPLTVTAANVSKTYDGNAYSGNGGASYSGFVNGETSAVLGGSLSFGGTAAGAVNAGSYSLVPSGLTASNYAISYANGALTVNPATLTYSAATASRSYGAANPGFTGSVTGFVGSDTLGSATTGTPSFASTATTNTGAGSHAIDGSGLTAANYVFAQAAGNATALTITPAPLTVAAHNATKTYDGLAYGGGNGVSYSGFVNGETSAVLGGSLSYGGDSQGALHAGSYAITPQGLSAANYALSYTGGTLTVNPAALTVTVTPVSRSYGAANPGFASSVTGFVNGETLASATGGSLAYSTGATTTSGVGSYGVSATGLTANHGNYVISQAAGNSSALTVTPAPLTVTAANDSRIYDGSPYNGGNGVSYSGFVNGETSAVLSGSLNYGGSSQGAVNAGSYGIVPSGLSAANYAITYTPGALTISPAVLAVITGSLTGSISKTYDGSATATLAPANFLLSGFVNGDGATVTQTLGSFADANAGTAKTVTVTLASSDFSATGNTVLANYTLPTSVSGNIGHIAAAPLLVTAHNASKTYDALAFSGGHGVSYSGFVNGETAAVLGGSLGFAGSSQGAVNAGSYTLLPQGLAASNYAISYGSGSLTITPAALAIAATAHGKTYDGTTAITAAPTVIGLQGSDTVTGLTQAYADKRAGSGKTVSVTGYTVNDGNGGGNYTVSVAGSTAGVIERATATVQGTATTVTYNGATQAQTAPTANGFLSGDAITIAGAASGRNAGVYDSALSVSGADAGNYHVTVNNAALTIGRAPLTIQAAANTKTYDGTTASAATPTASGLLAGDTVSALQQAYASQNAGSGKTLNVTGYALNDGNGGGNYAVTTLASQQGSIAPATLTVSVAPAARNAGSANPAFTASVAGFVGGDTLASATTGSWSFSTPADTGSLPGPYAVTASGLTALLGNYVFAQAPGNASALAVTEAPVAPQQFLPRATPVPNFPDNAVPALGNDAGRVLASSLNYIAMPQAPTAAAAPSAAVAPVSASVAAPAAEAAAPLPTSSTAFVITEAQLSQFGQGTPLAADTAPAAPTVATGPNKVAKLGTAGVAVPSANGPLDIYVVDGGVNLRGRSPAADR
jgi:filamentous hemagglutinin family protein